MLPPVKGDSESRFDYASLTDIRRIAIAADIRSVATALGDQRTSSTTTDHVVAAYCRPGHLSPLFARSHSGDPSTRVSGVGVRETVMSVTHRRAMQLACGVPLTYTCT